jgi:hypothetical protein
LKAPYFLNTRPGKAFHGNLNQVFWTITLNIESNPLDKPFNYRSLNGWFDCFSLKAFCLLHHAKLTELLREVGGVHSASHTLLFKMGVGRT